MQLHLHPDPESMGRAAAEAGGARLRQALEQSAEATVIVATGASQFTMLDHLATLPDLDWHRVHGFHLDEYIGLPITHPASFRAYLWQRFVRRLPLPLAAFHYLDGEGDAAETCRRVGGLIADRQVDVAFVGIGENGHLAFNDPPANFDTVQPYLVVDLDEACRRQQLGEGWFPDLDSVPRQAISMSVHRILQSRTLIVTVPDERKAEAVRAAVEGPVTPDVPASILQRHPDCHLFLDRAAAGLLSATRAGG